MIALDTNVLVRFLVADDPKQCAAAKRLVETAIATGEGVFVGTVVLCELAWVLASVYEYSREEVRAVMRSIAASGNIVVEGSEELVRAVDDHERGRGDLADYVIRESARRAGCDAVATFDRQLLKEPGFRLP